MVGAWCFDCCQAHWSLPIGFLLLRCSVLCTLESFSLLLFCILIYMYMFWEKMHGQVRGISCKPSSYVFWSTSNLRVMLALWTQFKPSSKNLFTDCCKAVLFCGSFVLLCFLWMSCFCACSLLPCGHLLRKGWPGGSCLLCLLRFLTFPCGILGQVWYFFCINS